MALFRVIKTIEAYVQADSEEEAERVKIDENGCDVTVTAALVKSTKWVSNDWLDVNPFKHWSDKSADIPIKEILSAQASLSEVT